MDGDVFFFFSGGEKYGGGGQKLCWEKYLEGGVGIEYVNSFAYQNPPIHSPVSYRFPRVFVDEFSDNFGDSLTFVTKLVTHLVIASL